MSVQWNEYCTLNPQKSDTRRFQLMWDEES